VKKNLLCVFLYAASLEKLLQKEKLTEQKKRKESKEKKQGKLYFLKY
jgi:hypothetical protein